MSEKYNYIEKQYPARPRSQRRRDAGDYSVASGTTLITTNVPAVGGGGVTSHNELNGIVSTEDTYSEFSREIHLTAPDADALKRLSGLEVIKLKDLALPTDENVFSSLRTLDEIRKKVEDNTVTLDTRYLRKDIDDKAEGNILFDKNVAVSGEASLQDVQIGGALYSDPGAAAYDKDGFHLSATDGAWVDRLRVKEDSAFGGNLSSPAFASGFPAGKGWALTWRDVVNAAGVAAKKAHLEVDDLTIRGVLRVYEMVVSQLLGENGTRLTTDMMKVRSVDTAQQIIYLDTEENVLYNPFRKDDVLMVQRFGGVGGDGSGEPLSKQYELVVEEAGIGSAGEGEDNRVDWIRYKNLVGDENLIAARDTLVRVDNLTNADRKGVIKQTSVEPGSPYIDVIYGMKTDPEQAVRTRMGKLDGLATPYWGPLDGYGIYCDNLYAKGRFLLQTGEDVKTKFELLEGLLHSEISSVKTLISAKDNYLANASFALNTDKWATVNEQNTFAVGKRLLMFNENLYVNKKKIAAVVTDKGKKVLHIKNSIVRQTNADLANHPRLETAEGGAVQLPTFYVSFQYKCIVPGLLKIGFAGQPLYLEENLTPTNGYVTREFSGQWDGTGDFVLECQGDACFAMLALTTDALADFEVKMKTVIEQTDEHIRLLGEKVDKNAGSITNLGIVLDNVSESLQLYATKDTVNNLESRYQSSMLELTPEKINLTVSEQITRVSDAAKAAAIVVANQAKEAADKGIADAKSASDRLTGWASDGLISPPEKLTLKQESKNLSSEKEAILSDAAKYAVSTTAYTSAYNNYLGELAYHSTPTPENIAIRSTFSTYQSAYYAARQSILDLIASKTKQTAKDYADNVGSTLTSSLNVEKGRIDAIAGKWDANGNLREGAGWITETKGNTFWATHSQFNTLTGRVELAETSIRNTAHDITLKASQSFAEQIDNRVNANEFAIGGLSGRIKDTEAAIKLNADSIISKVSVSDYNGNRMVSEINQTAYGVRILADKVAFNAYNQNMIRNSGDCKNTAYWQIDGNATDLKAEYGGVSAIFTNSWGNIYNKSLAGIKLFAGRTYTLRISIAPNIPISVPVWIGDYKNDFAFAAEAAEYTWKFTATTTSDAKFFKLYCDKSCSILINWIKLEEGEYATPWTPHPSDSIYSTDSDLVAALNGTTISGGLQLTTRIKLGLQTDNNVWSEQGGISANTDNIMLWAGGTYEQAKTNNAMLVLRHDGSMSAAKGKFLVSPQGDLVISGALRLDNLERSNVLTIFDAYKITINDNLLLDVSKFNDKMNTGDFSRYFWNRDIKDNILTITFDGISSDDNTIFPIITGSPTGNSKYLYGCFLKNYQASDGKIWPWGFRMSDDPTWNTGTIYIAFIRIPYFGWIDVQ